MLFMKPRENKVKLEISTIDLPLHNCRLCDFCPEMSAALFEIRRYRSNNGITQYLACDRCAYGWHEIGDANEPKVI